MATVLGLLILFGLVRLRRRLQHALQGFVADTRRFLITAFVFFLWV